MTSLDPVTTPRARRAPRPTPRQATRRARPGAGLLVLLLLPGLLAAQEGPPPEASGEAGDGLAPLAWLAGHWRAEMPDGALNETVMLAPRAGVMTGAMRLSRHGTLMVQELIAVAETDEGLEMRLRHFDRGLAAMEETPIVLRLVESSATETVFRGHWQGGSIRSVIRRTGEDTWTGRNEITAADGRTSVIESHFERASGPAGPPPAEAGPGLETSCRTSADSASRRLPQ